MPRSSTSPLPREGGTYVLLCESSAEAPIAIGKLGTLALRKGWYAYVGSAFGPGGLSARIGRHLRRDKPQRWHLDYLRPHVVPRGVWYRTGRVRCEPCWAATLAKLPGAAVPLQGFGASDHPGASHLLRFHARPSLLHFKTELDTGSALCSDLREWRLDERA